MKKIGIKKNLCDGRKCWRSFNGCDNKYGTYFVQRYCFCGSFVDVLTTMSDESIPLTTFEYKEWGNPSKRKEYFYIKKYSPYDNIESKPYPSVLVTSSLFDSQVQYFEPAKYVPKLREFSTSNNPVLLKMNLIGGHAGKSGRLESLKETAEELSFIEHLASRDY